MPRTLSNIPNNPAHVPRNPAPCNHKPHNMMRPPVIVPTPVPADEKLKILESKLVPKDLINCLEMLVDADDNACIYADNNGVPVKILLKDIITVIGNIDWSRLASDVQNKILNVEQHIDNIDDNIDTINDTIQQISQSKQDNLIPGENITITNNVISAHLDGFAGVETINGMTGNVTLSADDVHALPDTTKLMSNDVNDLQNYYNKDATKDLIESVEIDGGYICNNSPEEE